MAMLAGLTGAVIAGLGFLGLADPAYFIALVGELQAPGMAFAAGAVRVVIGIALIASASASRWPKCLGLLGGMIFIGGLVTPFEGALLGRTLLSMWPTWGPGVVRALGGLIALLGLLVIYSVLARRKA
jgi:hypothetical protein